MNKLLLFICCIALSKTAIAQRDSLAFDDHNKYIYYKVAGMDKYSADTLFARSLRFLKNNGPQNNFKVASADAKTTVIIGTGFFIIYKPAMAKHSDGQIAYTFNLEIKEGKYRYWLTSFVYTPYFRDRYNNYVPDNNVQIPLEKTSTAITEREHGRYLDEAALFARQLGEKLKLYLSNTPVEVKKESPKKVIHINNW